MMELFDNLLSPVESLLCAKADITHTPIGGTIELLPLCNMDCRMCYVRLTKEEMESQGNMLSAYRWISIAESAREAGVLFLLITGGEPFLYPEFEKLYMTLTSMGFVITINTNGTLINSHWAKLLGKRPPRRLNISLYGPDDEAYSRLCNNPSGFTQVMEAVSLLKEQKVPFRFTHSITPQNILQLDKTFQVARDKEIYLEPSYYMFPPARKCSEGNRFQRLTPEEAARARIDVYRNKHQNADMVKAADMTLNQLTLPNKVNVSEGFACRGGRSGFWINWRGELLPCGMFDEPREDLLNQSFSLAWGNIVEKTKKLPRCAECEDCKKKKLCQSCAASCYTESGSTDGCPDYLCKMTDEFIRLLLDFLEEDKKNIYLSLLAKN